MSDELTARQRLEKVEARIAKTPEDFGRLVNASDIALLSFYANQALDRISTLESALAASEQRVQEAEARAEWREIGEKRSHLIAPHNGKPVLLWKEVTQEYYVAAWITGAHGPGWCTPDGFEIFRATHWQPLPDPPDRAREARKETTNE